MNKVQRRRLWAMTSIVARHFGVLVGQSCAISIFGLGQKVLRFENLGDSWVGRRVENYDLERPLIESALRSTLSELGPTFIKIAQILSARHDVLPDRLQAVLARFQDEAPAIGIGLVETMIRNELGKSPGELFASFDPVPIAAASIGQVHAACLDNGDKVVVKVRRPGVQTLIEADFAVLSQVASWHVFRIGSLGRIDFVGLVDELAKTIREELDYGEEARNAKRLAQTLAPLDVHVPAIYEDLSSGGVLVMERIFGIKIDDKDALDLAGVDCSLVALCLTKAYLTMVFIEGFYHADPHPGNVFIDQCGRLALVDFGMVGKVVKSTRIALIEVLLGIVTHDMTRNASALRSLGVAPLNIEQDAFIIELERVTAASIEIPLGEMRLAPLLLDVMRVGRRYHLHFPRELALLIKTVVMCEGVAANLDPTFALPLVLVSFVAETAAAGQLRDFE